MPVALYPCPYDEAEHTVSSKKPRGRMARVRGHRSEGRITHGGGSSPPPPHVVVSGPIQIVCAVNTNTPHAIYKTYASLAGVLSCPSIK